VSTPVLNGVAGDTQAGLSWTPSVGVLGWTVSGYEVGQGTVSGGPYSYTGVGNVLATTSLGLTNGTAYYFVIRALDAFGNPIGSSNQISVTPLGTTPPPSGGGGGGGGGGGYQSQTGSVDISIKAYPNALVTILDNGVATTTYRATPGGDVSTRLLLTPSDHQLGVFAIDEFGRYSATFSSRITVRANDNFNFGTIFLSPTIEIDKSTVKRGDTLTITGSTYPNSTITIFTAPDILFTSSVRTVQVIAGANGRYAFLLATKDLNLGTYFIRARGANGKMVSDMSRTLQFVVGNTSQPVEPLVCAPADLNNDKHVNIVDFSIATFWYKKVLTGAFIEKEKNCLNGDGKVDIYDFSMMAYYWTG
jgi:hypothetical protein